LFLPRRLPVSFRPYPGEALSSWLARTARVYSLDLVSLLTSYQGFDSETIETLDTAPNSETLQFLSMLTGADVYEITRCTLAGSHPAWLPNWTTWQHAQWNTTERRTVFPIKLSVNVCPRCLCEDAEQGREQHLRLEWLCAARTLCERHLLPLVARCSMATCHHFLQSQLSRTANRLYCVNCSSFLDGNGSCIAVGGLRARQQLGRFEQQLCAELSSRSIDFIRIPSAEYLTMAEDLIWALTRMTSSGDRPIHFLQTLQYPVPDGFRLPFETSHWLSRTTVGVRRSLLATVAMMLRPDREAAVLCTSTLPDTSNLFEQLQTMLEPDDRRELLTRASKSPLRLRFDRNVQQPRSEMRSYSSF
jgi:TniQ